MKIQMGSTTPVCKEDVDIASTYLLPELLPVPGHEAGVPCCQGNSSSICAGCADCATDRLPGALRWHWPSVISPNAACGAIPVLPCSPFWRRLRAVVIEVTAPSIFAHPLTGHTPAKRVLLMRATLTLSS